ncbi:MAG TPA: WD40 repeat domain-containing protein [Thermoanaerobaculia bacterium]
MEARGRTLPAPPGDRPGRLTTAALAGLIALGWATLRWSESSRDARASGLALVSRQSSGTDANRRLDGLAYAASSLAEEPSPLGSATLVEAARALPQHLRSIVHDRGGKAADLVRFLDHDRLILSAGYTKVLQLAAADTGQVVGRIALLGRARGLAVHPSQPLLAVATQGGLDLLSYTPGSSDPAPRIVGRAAAGARVQAVLFEPGGTTLLAGDFAGNLARYRLADAGGSPWRPVRTLRLTDPDGAGVGISGMALDPGSGRLAVAGILGRIDCLAADDWKRRKSIEHSSEIFALAASPDGRIAAAADADGGILLFRPVTCEVTGHIAPPVTEDTVARGLDGTLQSAPRSERPFVGIAFSPDGSLLGVASHDRTVRIYTADRGALTHILVHPAMARAVAFATSGSLVTTGDNGGQIDLWDTAATVESWRLGGIDAFAVDPRGRWIAAWAAKGPLALLDPGSGRTLAEDRPSDDAFRGGIGELVATADGHLAARLTSHLAFVWDLSSPGPRPHLPPPLPLVHPNDPDHVAIVGALAAGPDPAGLVTGERYQGRSVRLWDGAKATQRRAFPMTEALHAVAAAGDFAAAVDASGLVRVVRALSGSFVDDLRLPGAPQAFALAPDGRHLFAGFRGTNGSGACLCHLGKPEAPGLLARLAAFVHRRPADNAACAATRGPLHCSAVFPGRTPSSARFAPQGDAVAVAVSGPELDDGSLFLLRHDNDRQPVLLASAGQVRALDFSTDGTLLAAGGHSRAVEIFDLSRDSKTAEIPLSNPVLDVRFLPGPEHRILTRDVPGVGFLRLWDWRPASLLAAACARWPESFAPVRNPALPAPRSRRELCGR